MLQLRIQGQGVKSGEHFGYDIHRNQHQNFHTSRKLEFGLSILSVLHSRQPNQSNFIFNYIILYKYYLPILLL